MAHLHTGLLYQYQQQQGEFMIAKCTHCLTSVEANDSNMEHYSYMDPGYYQVRCDACTKWFNFKVPDENIPDKTALKTLTSSTPWINEWAQWRAVDANGDLHEYQSRPIFAIDSGRWDNHPETPLNLTKYRYIGSEYDASQWMNTLQERVENIKKVELAPDEFMISIENARHVDPIDLTDEYWVKEKQGVYNLEKKLCQYVNDYYHIPAYVGMTVWVEGVEGKIVEDRGRYIGITFHDESAGIVHNFHPTSHGLVYDLPKKSTVRDQLHARPWPVWAKELFMERCTEYGYKLTETMHLSQCFEWCYTPEGIGFWDRLITNDSIKEEDFTKFYKANKVEETKIKTVQQLLEERNWPHWVKDLFIVRLTHYSLYEIPFAQSLNSCFTWSETPEGIEFWGNAVIDDIILEKPTKENKVEETKPEPVTTGLKDILEALPSLSNKELDHVMTRCVNQFTFRATDRKDYTELMLKYDSLREYFDTLVEEKSELQCELEAYKKHMKKIIEAVERGDA